MQRDKIKPILFSIIKHSSKEELKEQLPRDIVSGIVVAIVALPLSIALAIASGVGPEQGLYTAIVAGFLIAFLGGSRVQISGPTAAFATIVAGIVATDGIDGLVAATLIAGVLLVVMGLLKLGTIIRFVPYTITTGFTACIFCNAAFYSYPCVVKPNGDAWYTNTNEYVADSAAYLPWRYTIFSFEHPVEIRQI